MLEDKVNMAFCLLIGNYRGEVLFIDAMIPCGADSSKNSITSSDQALIFLVTYSCKSTIQPQDDTGLDQ